MEYLAIGFVLFIGMIFVLRLLGAWMLRIDEIIKHQKTIIRELRKMNGEKLMDSSGRKPL